MRASLRMRVLPSLRPLSPAPRSDRNFRRIGIAPCLRVRHDNRPPARCAFGSSGGDAEDQTIRLNLVLSRPAGARVQPQPSALGGHA